MRRSRTVQIIVARESEPHVLITLRNEAARIRHQIDPGISAHLSREGDLIALTATREAATDTQYWITLTRLLGDTVSRVLKDTLPSPSVITVRDVCISENDFFACEMRILKAALSS